LTGVIHGVSGYKKESSKGLNDGVVEGETFNKKWGKKEYWKTGERDATFQR